MCLASRATIGVAASATADRLRDRDNTARIGNNSAEIGDNSAEIGDNSAVIGDGTAGIVDITGVTLFLEDKFLRGFQSPSISWII